MPFCFLSPLNYPGNLFLFCLLIHLEKLGRKIVKFQDGEQRTRAGIFISFSPCVFYSELNR
jgi:hypothetical protein